MWKLGMYWPWCHFAVSKTSTCVCESPGSLVFPPRINQAHSRLAANILDVRPLIPRLPNGFNVWIVAKTARRIRRPESRQIYNPVKYVLPSTVDGGKYGIRWSGHGESGGWWKDQVMRHSHWLTVGSWWCQGEDMINMIRCRDRSCWVQGVWNLQRINSAITWQWQRARLNRQRLGRGSWFWHGKGVGLWGIRRCWRRKWWWWDRSNQCTRAWRGEPTRWNRMPEGVKISCIEPWVGFWWRKRLSSLCKHRQLLRCWFHELIHPFHLSRKWWEGVPSWTLVKRVSENRHLIICNLFLLAQRHPLLKEWFSVRPW